MIVLMIVMTCVLLVSIIWSFVISNKEFQERKAKFLKLIDEIDLGVYDKNVYKLFHVSSTQHSKEDALFLMKRWMDRQEANGSFDHKQYDDRQYDDNSKTLNGQYDDGIWQ